MKRVIFCILNVLAATIAYGRHATSNSSLEPVMKPVDRNQAMANMKGPLLFVENKGQITDQNLHPRSDIQFKTSADAGLNIFIGTGAIHYQFSRPNVNESKGKKTDP